MQDLPSTDFMSRAWAQTGEDSQLCDYCLESIHWILTPSSETEEELWESKLPTSEVLKMFQDHPSFNNAYITLSRSREPQDPREIEDKCYFHVHGAGDVCPPNYKKRNNSEIETPEGQVVKRSKTGQASL